MATKIIQPKIVQPGSGPRFLAWLLLLALAAGAGAVWYHLDLLLALNRDFEVTNLREAVALQQQQIADLEGERHRLRQQIAALERASQIDREAVRRSKEELQKYQDEHLEFQEELTFLRGLVSNGTAKAGLRVRDFRIESGGEPTSYRYRFTVAQVLKDQETVSGKIFVTLDGKREGKDHSLPLKEITRDKEDSLKVSFKHFQELEGELVLPEGFEPIGVTIDVKPEGEGLAPTSRRYDWTISS